MDPTNPADKGKNIFQQAIDAVSNRDEKAAIEAAMKHAQELEQQVAQLQQEAAAAVQKQAATEQRATQAEQNAAQLTANLTSTKKELETTCSDLITAKNTVTILQQRLDATNTELQKYVSAEQAKQIAAAAEAAAKAKVIAEHTITPDETLSHVALKYYGSAYEPYWRVIYEANKDTIGPNPALVRPGMVLKIPVLPEELAKK